MGSSNAPAAYHDRDDDATTPSRRCPLLPRISVSIAYRLRDPRGAPEAELTCCERIVQEPAPGRPIDWATANAGSAEGAGLAVNLLLRGYNIAVRTSPDGRLQMRNSRGRPLLEIAGRWHLARRFLMKTYANARGHDGTGHRRCPRHRPSDLSPVGGGRREYRTALQPARHCGRRGGGSHWARSDVGSRQPGLPGGNPGDVFRIAPRPSQLPN